MKLAIVAGEASGDLHASEVVQELKKLHRDLEMFGIGGDLLAREGMTLLHHAREMGIVGVFNVLRNIRMFKRIFYELIDRIRAERPDAVLLVDYPGFNLRVAKRCRAMGIKVVYYISPQVWAWRQGRVKEIAKVVDRMIVIFPFEEEFYRKHNVPVVYVGNPLIDELNPRPATPVPRPDLRLALLPGSRRNEIHALLPPMLDAVAILQKERPVDAYIIQAPTITASELLQIMGERHVFVRIVAHEGGDAIAAADVALSSSGTATLECAVLGTPVVVMYRLTRITFFLARRLVKVPHFSLVNIVAGKNVVPELIQHEVNGERIAKEVRRLAYPEEHARVVGELSEVRRRLGEPGASRRAAIEIDRLLNE
jgi:lipid-A-disaccharide synthase